MKHPIEILYLQLGSILILLGIPVVSLSQITIDCPDTSEYCSSQFDCTGTFLLQLPAATSANCSGELTFTFQVSIDGGTIIASGNLPPDGTALSGLPITELEILIEVADNCGNSNTCTTIYQGYDCTDPLPICINGVSVSLLPVAPNTDADGDGDDDIGAAAVWASDFDNGSYDNCSAVTLSINRVGETPNINKDHIILTCDDAALTTIEIYAWDDADNPNAIQPDGTVGGPNYDYCETYVLIDQGAGNPCSYGPSVSGKITTPEGDAISGVQVSLGNFVTHTDTDGSYIFEDLVQGQDYTLTPLYDADPGNGVSTYDVIAISKHLQGIELLDSPYKLIAADVDNNQFLTASDIAQLENVIVNNLPSFPNNTSWRFISAEYNFPDPTNPYAEVFPEVVNINNLLGNLSFDFIGVKIGDVDGNADTHLDPITNANISGKVYFDQNENCEEDDTESGLNEWIIEADNGVNTYYALTNDEGIYDLNLPSGNYTVSAVPINPNWNVCVNDISINAGVNEQITHDFAAQTVAPCPYMLVDISTPAIEACGDGTYYVQYKNTGPDAAANAYVEVTIDDFMSVTSSSIVWTSAVDNTYTFPIGNVASGESGLFTIEYSLSCDAVVGQTHCTTAEIFPQEDCSPEDPLWDGASLAVSAVCQEDSVKFLIENLGDPMELPVQYIVIEDDLLMLTDEVVLGAGESTMVAHIGDGSTKRLELDQSIGHPGNSQPSISLEGCGVDDLGNISLGYVTQFTEDDLDPFVSIDCQESEQDVEFNHKKGFPKGVGPNNLIEANTSIEYQINFQNESSSTVSEILIVDELDGALDPSTIQLGASSHPYTWNLTDQGRLVFHIQNIELPPASEDEDGSKGFVKFEVAQQIDNIVGTYIFNSATIYFAPVDVVSTDLVTHVIGEDFIDQMEAIIDVNVANVFGDALANVDVQINGLAAGSTDMNGQFSTSPVSTGADYDFDLAKAADYQDGQSTFDLLLMVINVLGQSTFDHPYLYFAADMDGNGAVSTLDIILLQRSLLGLQMPDESGWYFYKNHNFADINNPWSEVGALDLVIENLSDDIVLEVVGVKKGDLNGTASTSFQSENPNDRNYDGTIEVWLNAEQIDENLYVVSCWTEDQDIAVYQVDISPLEASFALPFLGMSSKTASGGLRTIGTNVNWNQNGPHLLTQIEMAASSKEEALKNIKLEPTSLGHTPDFQTFELVIKDDLLMTDGFQVLPNPSDRGFEIHHYLAQISDVELELYDMRGRFIQTLAKDLKHPSGNWNYQIDEAELESGMYILQLRTNNSVMTERIIKL